MGYKSEEYIKFALGGLGPDSGAVAQGNSPRPQQFVGKYVTDIPGALSRPSDDGKEHPGIAPQQGFRKELPPAKSNADSLMDGAYEPANGPTHDDVQKKWR